MSSRTDNLPDLAEFVKWAGLALVAIAGLWAVQPDPPAPADAAAAQDAAGRQVLAWQAEDPARASRALNRCMPASFDAAGRVDWIYVRDCYGRTR